MGPEVIFFILLRSIDSAENQRCFLECDEVDFGLVIQVIQDLPGYREEAPMSMRCCFWARGTHQ